MSVSDGWRARIGWGLVPVALAVSLFALLSAARADGFTLTYREANADLPNDESSHEVAPLCPKGTKVLGGGVFTLPLSEDVEVTTTRPDDLGAERGSQPDDGWLAAAVNSSNDPTGLINVDAICGRGWNPRYSSATMPLPDGAVVGRGVRCPPGTHVTGGGVEISGNDKDLEVVSSFPSDGPDRGARPDNGWFGRASNDSGSPEEMTVHAVCTKLPGLVYRRVTRTLPPESVATIGRVRCLGATRVTGGGVNLNEGGLPSLDLEVAQLFPFDGPDRRRVPDDGWVGGAHNDGLTSATMKLFAICKRPAA